MLAIVSVVLLHSLPREVLFLSGAPYHIWQTVPIFIILAGYNAVNSYKRSNLDSLNQFYNFSFLYSKMERIIYPFLLVWLLQVVAQFVLLDGLSVKELFISALSGGWGPGSYFIPIIIQSTLILPVLFLLCRKNLTIMITLLFAISLILDWVCLNINIPESIYRLLVIRYLFALALGVWLALYSKKIHLKWLLPLAILSFVYIAGVNYFDWVFIMEKFWLSQHTPSYFWTLILVILVLKGYQFKAQNQLSKLSVKIGQASYHIFLTQMLYFWAIASRLPAMPIALYVSVSLVVCLALGFVFFYLDNWIRKEIKLRSSSRNLMT